MSGKKIATTKIPGYPRNRGAERVLSGLVDAKSSRKIQQNRSELAATNKQIGSKLLTVH